MNKINDVFHLLYFCIFGFLCRCRKYMQLLWDFLHLATAIRTRLFAKLTRGPKSGDVTGGGVRGLVTFGDKGGARK